MRQRLYQIYQERVVPKLCAEFKYRNLHQVPRIEKIVINRGIGDVLQRKKRLECFLSELTLIAAQRGVVRYAKTAISRFKVRKGTPVGLKVTLRGPRIYAFLDRLMNLALPRIRDFQGVHPKSFDGQGNYRLGVEEQLIFPEIHYEKVTQVRGIDISISISARTDSESLALLDRIGIPFQNILFYVSLE